jgi:hypothetical protein
MLLIPGTLEEFRDCMHPARFISYEKDEIKSINDALKNCSYFITCRYTGQCNLKDVFHNVYINKRKKSE